MIAIVPYELRKENSIGRINFDQLIWIKGHPDTNGTIDSLSSKDHIIIYPSSNIWLFNYKKFNCNISLIIEEPRAVQKRYYSWLWLIRTKFHKVFVRYQCLGIKYENVTSFPIVQCWTKGVNVQDQKRKDKLISLIASNKDKLPGHKIRHQIIEQLTTINYDVSFEHAPFFNLSVTHSTLQRVIIDIIFSLASNKIKTVFIINGHHGNIKSLQSLPQKITKHLYGGSEFLCRGF